MASKAISNRAKTSYKGKSATTIRANGSGAGGGKTRGVFADRSLRVRQINVGAGGSKSARTVMQRPRGKR